VNGRPLTLGEALTRQYPHEVTGEELLYARARARARLGLLEMVRTGQVASSRAEDGTLLIDPDALRAFQRGATR
jgi:hypothetical protein